MKPKVIVSKLTTYDDDEMVYHTKVGLDNQERTLLFIAIGNTIKKSKSLAYRLAKLYQSQFTP